AGRAEGLQGALLLGKPARLEAWTAARRRIAARYREALAGAPVTLPSEREPARHVYHLYTIRHPRRDALARALAERGIGTAVHYPIPVPVQPMFGLPQRHGPDTAPAAPPVLPPPPH